MNTSKTTDNKPLKLEAPRPFSLFEKIKAEYTRVGGFFFPPDILPTGYASKISILKNSHIFPFIVISYKFKSKNDEIRPNYYLLSTTIVSRNKLSLGLMCIIRAVF